jgi:hypothetical protein
MKTEIAFFNKKNGVHFNFSIKNTLKPAYFKQINSKLNLFASKTPQAPLIPFKQPQNPIQLNQKHHKPHLFHSKHLKNNSFQPKTHQNNIFNKKQLQPPLLTLNSNTSNSIYP